MNSKVLLDIAGVLTQGGEVVAGAPQALQRLRAADISLCFATNTSRNTRAGIGAELRSLGFVIEDAEILTAPMAARQAIVQRDLRPHLLIHPELAADFQGIDTHAPNAVLVGDAGDDFTYTSLNQAFRLLMKGAPLLAIARNRYFRERDGLSLDAGPFVQALEYASGSQAELFGKPAPGFFQAALTELKAEPAQVIMIGDDVEADVQGALAAGLQAILVRTGKYTAGDEARLQGQGEVVADLTEAVEFILGRWH